MIVRPAGETQGMPTAVARYPPFEFNEGTGGVVELRRPLAFPLEFSVGAPDMLLGGDFPSQVSLSMRLDTDGDAISRDPTDLAAVVSDPIDSGTQDLLVVLDRAAGNEPGL